MKKIVKKGDFKLDRIVSVIITTHERDVDILKRAIESVCCQTYAFLEIIVVNDAPHFSRRIELEAMIKSFSNVRYYLNESNPGACGSRNIGIKMAKGEVIALLDDDDTFEPTKIEEMLEFLDDDVGLVYCDINQIENGVLISRKKLQSSEGYVFEKLLFGNFIGGCSVPIIQKEVFNKVGFFDEELPSSQDIDMWLRIAREYPIKYCNKCLVNYYLSDVAITSNPQRRINGWRMILNKYSAYFDNNKAAKVIWINYCLEIIIQNGGFSEAFEYYNECYKGIDKILQGKAIVRGIAKYIQMKMGKRKR